MYSLPCKKTYIDIETAMELHKTQRSFIIGDFNAKIGKQECRNGSTWKAWNLYQNYRNDMLIMFARGIS